MKRAKEKMKCFSEENPNCKETLKSVKEDHKIKSSGKTITVPDVEVLICQKCGDKFYPIESAKKIDSYKLCSGKFSLRMDPPIHLALLQIAKNHRRSVNQEINQILENYIEKHEKSA